MKKGNRCASMESRIIRVPCSDDAGTPYMHTARVVANGHIGFVEHARGELSRGLKACELAGVKPAGCYALLHAWQVAMRTPMEAPMRWDPTPSHFIPYRRAADDVRKLRRAIRAKAPHVAVVQNRPVRGTRVIAVVQTYTDLWHLGRADALLLHGVPAQLSVPIGGGVHVWGGFAAARPRRSPDTVLWDMALPGVEGLVADVTDAHSAGVIALLRTTAKLLRGWLGLIPAVREGGVSARVSAS